jgi:thiamine biosynthesis lipoprotein
MMPDACHFTHEAMNTTFTLRIRGLDFEDAKGMATECFHQLERMETDLSRFIDGGDVSRINRLAAGETLYVSETCHQCLLLALDAYARTGGLFDITLGSRIEHRKAGSSGPAPEVTGRLIIHPDVAAVTCEEPGRQIDLGGIGKGFALDRLKETLIDWGAGDFLLAAGASSLLAHGPTVWPVELPGERNSVRLPLHREALSASGTRIQGCHIVHPAGDESMPARPCDRVWVTAPTAALAEVWSTALMLLPMEGIPAFLAEDSGISSVHAEFEGMVEALRVGRSGS